MTVQWTAEAVCHSNAQIGETPDALFDVSILFYDKWQPIWFVNKTKLAFQ